MGRTRSASPTTRKDNSPPWSWSYGERPHTVYARERLDRGGLIEVRYSDLELASRDKRKKYFLHDSIKLRNHKGIIDRQVEREVHEIVRQINARLLTGRNARIRDESASPDELTLAEGFRKLLHPRNGRYSDPNTRHVKYNVRPRSEYAIRLLRTELQRTGESLPTWATFRASHARMIWRAIARENKNTGQGRRKAEQVVDIIYAAAFWLRQEELIPPTACLPPQHWRKQLKDEWEAMTGVVATPQRPRHTREEMHQIFTTISDPTTKIDPRIRLAIELGAELRVGQVLRTKRSQLKVTAIEPNDYISAYQKDLTSREPQGILGRVEIHGRGKKNGEVVVLTPEQRHAVDAALAGYLCEYEYRYQQDEKDYYLFPSHKPIRGVSPFREDARPADKDAALKWFKRLEEVAEVKPVRGRGWYGLRRTATDVAPEYSSDARELNSLGGWSDSETREGVYQDRAQVQVKARASAVRRAARAGLGQQSEQPEPTPTPDLKALLESLNPAQREQLAILMAQMISESASILSATGLDIPQLVSTQN